MSDYKATEFNNLKTKIRNEVKRRKHTGSVEAYGDSQYDFTDVPAPGKYLKPEHVNKLATPVRAINPTGVVKDTFTSGEDVPSPSEITAIDAQITLYASKGLESSSANTGCGGACTGLCSTACTGSCSGSCTGSCSGCSGTCTDSCSGCSSCSGSCSGSCSSCSGCSGCSSCSGGCDGCRGNCTSGSCGGSCSGSGSCSSSCSGGCESCDWAGSFYALKLLEEKEGIYYDNGI